MLWSENLIDDDARLGELLRTTRRVAVLGIKTEQQAGKPAYYVPKAAQRAGYEIIPVPVHYPEATRILGQPVFRSVSAIPGRVDLVDVFRRSEDVPGHLEDLLAANPGCVWMQSGIRNPEVAERLAKAGIKVVQSRCLMVEIGRLGGPAESTVRE